MIAVLPWYACRRYEKFMQISLSEYSSWTDFNKMCPYSGTNVALHKSVEQDHINQWYIFAAKAPYVEYVRASVVYS